MSNTNYHCTRTKDGKIMFFANGKRVTKDRYIEIAGELDERTCLTTYERKQLIKMAIQSIGKIRDRENQLLEECHSSLRQCHNRVSTLENELKAATDRLVGNQAAEDQKLRDEIVSLNGLLESNREDALRQLGAVRRELEQQISELLKKIQDLESVNAQYKQESSDFLSREGEMKNEISDLKNQIKVEQDKFVAQTVIHEASIDEGVDDMLSILNGILDEKIELKQIFDKYGTNVRKADVVKQILEKFNQIRENIAQLQNAKAELDSALSSNAEKDSRIADLERSLRESQEECANQTAILKARVSELEEENKRVNAALEDVNGRLAECESKTKQLTADYLNEKAGMQAVIDSINVEKVQLTRSFNDLNASKLLSNNEINELKAQRDRDIKMLSDLEAKLRDYEAIREQLKQEKESHEKLKNEYAQVQSQLNDMSSKYPELETKYSVLESKYSDLTISSSGRAAEYDDLQDKYNQLIRDSSSKSQEYEKVKAQYVDMQTRYDELSEKNKSIESRMNESTQKLIDLENELNISKDTINQLTEQKKTLSEADDKKKNLAQQMYKNAYAAMKVNKTKADEQKYWIQLAKDNKIDASILDIVFDTKKIKEEMDKGALEANKANVEPEANKANVEPEAKGAPEANVEPKEKGAPEQKGKQLPPVENALKINAKFKEIDGLISRMVSRFDATSPEWRVAPQFTNPQIIKAYNEFSEQRNKFLAEALNVFKGTLRYKHKVVSDALVEIMTTIMDIKDLDAQDSQTLSLYDDFMAEVQQILRKLPSEFTDIMKDEEVRKNLNETYTEIGVMFSELMGAECSSYNGIIVPSIKENSQREEVLPYVFLPQSKQKFDQYLEQRNKFFDDLSKGNCAELDVLNNFDDKKASRVQSLIDKINESTKYEKDYIKWMNNLAETINNIDVVVFTDDKISFNRLYILETLTGKLEEYKKVKQSRAKSALQKEISETQFEGLLFGKRRGKRTSRVKRVKRSKGKSGKKKRTMRKSRV